MDVHKLAKVLAMAASDNEAEAVHALRTAARLLDNAGLDFVALAERLSESEPPAAAGRLDELEDTVFDLRNELRHLRAENERLRRETPPPPAAASLAGAAQDAAHIIRLRAELDAARDDLARAMADGLARDQAFHSDLAQAADMVGRLTEQVEQARGRAARLEAENRRLSLVAGALKAELDERAADRLHPLPSPTQRPETIVRPEPMARPEPSPRRPPPAAARRGKAAPAGQYALF
ncbi:DUF2786 domain-containing protein [Magnetospirillum sp. SS-4]|uniref:DUF2786 domain-containing protein n=1 Tax=Magnetospirillum sp. SS-4 TaxID=2681465 RepID=UPI00137D7207|nr:DUF2786 domain-containing protein [Magnetospirillum sp. SS-4]CAA7623335.1 Metalloendopeptidase-like membrane protein [Magnetospirillum sp. SS-4]